MYPLTYTDGYILLLFCFPMTDPCFVTVFMCVSSWCVRFSLGWVPSSGFAVFKGRCSTALWSLLPACFPRWVYHITSYCLCVRTPPCSPLLLSDLRCYVCVDWICVSCIPGVVEHLVLYVLVLMVSSSVHFLCLHPFFFLLGCLLHFMSCSRFLHASFLLSKCLLISLCSLWLVFLLYEMICCIEVLIFQQIKFASLLW